LGFRKPKEGGLGFTGNDMKFNGRYVYATGRRQKKEEKREQANEKKRHVCMRFREGGRSSRDTRAGACKRTKRAARPWWLETKKEGSLKEKKKQFGLR